jgi:hypothetical protein
MFSASPRQESVHEIFCGFEMQNHVVRVCECALRALSIVGLPICAEESRFLFVACVCQMRVDFLARCSLPMEPIERTKHRTHQRNWSLHHIMR